DWNSSISHCDSRSLHSLASSFNNTAPPATYTLSLHDALPILSPLGQYVDAVPAGQPSLPRCTCHILEYRECDRCIGVEKVAQQEDRKSTRLNSSHRTISYAVFCLKKKKYLMTTNFMPAIYARH